MEITINYKGVDFDVEYDYRPYEKEVLYYADGSGYTGCSEAIEGINEFKHKDTCFLEWIEDKEDEIAELILKKMHEY